MKHPTAEDWMAFLYREAAPQRHSELQAHLAACPECARQVEHWTAAQKDLDRWVLPRLRAGTTRGRFGRVGWAAAAVLVLAAFVAGRLSSPVESELSDLKQRISMVTASANADRVSHSNAVYVAQVAAREEALRLLSEYTAVQAEQRQSDRQEVQAALADFESRLGRVRSELETVAINTYSGFEQTHRNLTRLASYTAPAGSKLNN